MRELRELCTSALEAYCSVYELEVLTLTAVDYVAKV